MRRPTSTVLLLAVAACGSSDDARTSVRREGELPGAEPRPAELRARLERAVREKGSSYVPRTKHRLPDGSPKYTNRLVLEKSPYLQQHAHNPVDWYPWGDEAFAAARRLRRPLLLSVGYSTCHWCHVMEEESFEDEEIAQYLNSSYVAIKVDREERPDVDGVYMSAVHALAGRGGWPMTVWLTPDREPFMGGTYFRPGAFLDLLRELREEFGRDAEGIAARAQRVARAVQRSLRAREATGSFAPGPEVLHSAVRLFSARFDEEWGGLSGAPKFPSALPVRLLLRYHRRTVDRRALEMATTTLDRMARGGMYDHVGGGFHRYSTDERWLVPHFEKMLYDNALLALAYLESFQVTGNGEYARVAREILRYVERDMTSPDGAFYSATDADSEGEEGRFFLWTPRELERVLGEERARVVAEYYDVSRGGNFEGRSILWMPRPHDEVARALGIPSARLRQSVDESRERLYVARRRRVPPLRDEKILAAWNGLMVSAFARAALVLGDPAYARTGARAARFVLERMREGGRLRRAYRDGRAGPDGYLDDYAFLAAGLLDLFEATGDVSRLAEAIALMETLERHYGDARGGGFFLSADDAERLLVREKPDRDGAEPSGNSVALSNLLRLHELTTDERWRLLAERTIAAFGPDLQRSPASLSEMLHAVDFLLDRPREVVLVAPAADADVSPFLGRLGRTFLPNAVLVVAVEGADLEAKRERIPLLAGKTSRDGRVTAYVCERGACELPTTDAAVFARQIAVVHPLGRL